MRILKSFAFLTPVVFIACATQPIAREAQKTAGQWETKVQVKDFQKQSSNNIAIDFIAVRNESLRAEVTGSFGISVATLAIVKDQFQLALHSQKKYYSGRISPRVMESTLGVNIDPRILYFALFDDPLPEKSFECTKDENGLPVDCRHKKGDLEVRWSERSGELKRVTLKNSQFEIQILVKNFTTKVQISDELFQVKAPGAYKSHHLD